MMIEGRGVGGGANPLDPTHIDGNGYRKGKLPYLCIPNLQIKLFDLKG